MANHHPSPTMMQMQHGGPHAPPPPPPPPQAAPPTARYGGAAPSRQIMALTEAVWIQIGSFAEVLGSPEEALQAYTAALRANPSSVTAMNAISLILRTREEFHKAVEFLQDILKLEPSNGEAWGSLGKRSRLVVLLRLGGRCG